MYRCVYCGNEYEEKVGQCEGCGSRKFEQAPQGLIILDPGVSFVPKRLPLRTIYKGQKPPPKPLPPPLRLEETYKGLMPRDGFWGPLVIVPIIVIFLMLLPWLISLLSS